MSMEVPVVTTPVVAAGLSVDGVEPQLVIGKNAEELAAGVAGLLTRAEERACLSKEGRRLSKLTAPGPAVRKNLKSYA